MIYSFQNRQRQIKAQKTLLAAFLLLLLGIKSPLVAQETAPGWQDFVEGHFESALEKSRSAKTADGFALACRSAIIIGGYLKTGQDAVDYLHRAIRLCEKSIMLDKNHLIGTMTYAMAIGFEGKRLKSPSYARISKNIFEHLMKTYPQNALARAAIGGWHSEVYSAGFLARLALGASRKKAETAFKNALELGELDMTLSLEYAKFLARGSKASRKKALSVLNQLISNTPEIAFEKLIQNAAIIIRKAIISGEKLEIRNSIKQTNAFPDIESVDNLAKIDLESFYHGSHKD